ncbi:6-phosphofructokinase [Ruminococcaceae bacterium OttesenSCG-928-L11]|nr:6-phosphofructokinase [Ruminococcaceae bacterium OttesenSCG-928-L11]
MLIAQSGGPTVAINASLSGAVKRAMKHPEIDQIWGGRNGLEGILNEQFVDLRQKLNSQEAFRQLESTPAMALGSCRYKLPEEPGSVYEKLRGIFSRYEIGYFFYIGGNDSMDTILKLSQSFGSVGDDVKCVGIPKTIDNDLPCTDHTPGFGSAARYIATSVAEIACDSAVYNVPSVTIVEIMGRNAGWLTAASVLARRGGCSAPHMICLPEVPFQLEKFLKRLGHLQPQVQNPIIAVSEGVRFAEGGYVSSQGEQVDAFGHRTLAGVGKYLEQLVRDNLGCKVRSIELNVLQRSASHLYSATDIGEACRIGAEAVSFAVQGKTGVMATFERVSDHPYLLAYKSADIRLIANREKTVPLEWIDVDRYDVKEALTQYLSPLICDENGCGIPVYFSL